MEETKAEIIKIALSRGYTAHYNGKQKKWFFKNYYKSSEPQINRFELMKKNIIEPSMGKIKRIKRSFSKKQKK